MNKQRRLGLEAIEYGRAARKRGRYSRPTPKLFFAFLLVVSSIVLAHHLYSSSQLEKARLSLEKKNITDYLELKQKWKNLEKNIFLMLKEASLPYPGDQNSFFSATKTLRSKPGLYLHITDSDLSSFAATLGNEEKSSLRLEELAAKSKRDSFASRMYNAINSKKENTSYHLENPDPIHPMLNENVYPEYPWNLGQAYRASETLKSSFLKSVRSASNDVELKLLSAQFERAEKDVLPFLVDVTEQTASFLLLVDEEQNESESQTDENQASQLALSYVARVYLFEIKKPSPVFWIRANLSTEAYTLGTNQKMNPKVIKSVRSQLESAALVDAVEAKLSEK